MTLVTIVLAAVLATPADQPGNGLVQHPQPAPRQHHVGVNLGAGSPVGMAGLTYDRDLGRRWQVQAGLAALGIPYTRDAIRPMVAWLNAEAGYQYERSWFFTQVGLGGSLLLHGRIRPPNCYGCDDPDRGPGTVLPALRLTTGYRF